MVVLKLSCYTMLEKMSTFIPNFLDRMHAYYKFMSCLYVRTSRGHALIGAYSTILHLT